MSKTQFTCRSTRSQVIDLYFAEHRIKVIDIAAFLDRVDRTVPDQTGNRQDFRLAALKRALAILQERQGQRTQRVLELFSDPTTDPIESASGMKSAHGAYPGTGE